MDRIFALILSAILLAACGSEEPTSDQDYDDTSFADDDWEEESLEDDPELGALRIDIAGDKGDTRAFCSLYITRMEDDEVATLSADLSMLGFDEEPSVNADFGELMANWGSDADNGTVTMGFNYEPPLPDDADADDLGWVYDPENPTPPSLSLMVDGKPYDFVGGDLRGTDDPSKAPHLWQTKLVMSANLVNPRDNGQNIRGQGDFEYDGLCSVNIRLLGGG